MTRGYDRFIELLNEEIKRTTREEVAYRTRIGVQSLSNYVRRRSEPGAYFVFRVFSAYPTTIASVLPDDTSLAEAMLSFPFRRRSTDREASTV